MFAILDHASRDDKVRCLVWTGEGRAFSSGAALGSGAAQTTIRDDLKEAMKERGMGPDGTMVLKSMTLAQKTTLGRVVVVEKIWQEMEDE